MDPLTRCAPGGWGAAFERMFEIDSSNSSVVNQLLPLEVFIKLLESGRLSMANFGFFEKFTPQSKKKFNTNPAAKIESGSLGK